LLLFLCFINDIPKGIESDKDSKQLHGDLRVNQLQERERKWQMNVNVTKCHYIRYCREVILSVLLILLMESHSKKLM